MLARLLVEVAVGVAKVIEEEPPQAAAVVKAGKANKVVLHPVVKGLGMAPGPKAVQHLVAKVRGTPMVKMEQVPPDTMRMVMARRPITRQPPTPAITALAITTRRRRYTPAADVTTVVPTIM
jgi:hypothetical protein